MKKLIIILWVLYFFSMGLVSKEMNDISKGPFITFVNGKTLDLNYSVIIESVKQKKIQIPLFKGVGGSITYEELGKLIESKNKKDGIMAGYSYEIRPGKTKKMLLEVIDFYKQSFLKNIDTDHPSLLTLEGKYAYAIIYDFEHEGLPCNIRIFLGYPSKKVDDKDLDSVQTLKFDEKQKGFIDVNFNFGEYSPFYKKK